MSVVTAVVITVLATSSALAAPTLKRLGDLYAGSGSSDPGQFTKLGTKFIFAARDASHGVELWKTKGTRKSTKLLKDINPVGDSWPTNLVSLNGYVYFDADDGHGEELWRTDGTSAGTIKVKDIDGNLKTGGLVDGPWKINGLLYFYGRDSLHGIELWRSNGTASGTKMLKDVNPGSGDSNRCCLVQMGNKVLFQAYRPDTGYELWKTKGTPKSTKMVADINPGSVDSYPLDDGSVAGGRYFFCAWPDDVLWVTDGTPGGTHMAKEFSYCSDPLPYGNDVLVSAADGGSGVELWRSNGTPDGTSLVTDLNPSGDAYPLSLTQTPVDGRYFYNATNGTTGRELYVYDGSSLAPVKDINPNGDSNPAQWGYAAEWLGNKVIFLANDGTHGVEPWISDGTGSGTVLLKDINVGGDSYAHGDIVINGRLYFVATSDGEGNEPWRTNGTTSGTNPLFDINPGPNGSYPDLSLVGGKLFVSADDGTHGREPFIITP